MNKRLYFDIETSPCTGWFWRPGYNLNLDYNNIIENAKIICICYKLAGKDRIYHLTWDAKKNDKQMLKDFIKVLNSADEIVGHNSDKFDIKWIRTRCLFHGISMMPDYTSIDTLKLARSGFNFPTNRLDSIGRYTKVGKKIKTTGELWYDVVFKNNKRALSDMVRYCKQDVTLLEDVHKVIEPYTKPKTRITEHVDECARCGSDSLQVKSYKISAAGDKKVQLQCQSCGCYQTISRAKWEKSKK